MAPVDDGKTVEPAAGPADTSEGGTTRPRTKSKTERDPADVVLPRPVSIPLAEPLPPPPVSFEPPTLCPIELATATGAITDDALESLPSGFER